MDYSHIPSAEYQHLSLVRIPGSSCQGPSWRRRIEGDNPWPDILIPHKRCVKVDRTRLESFQLFSIFPTEIRLNIWRFTCFPRAVEVRVIKAVNIPRKTCSFKAFHARTQLPAALSVCTESRAVVLPYYKLCFGSALRQDLAPSSIYFNPNADTLFFRVNQGAVIKHALKDFIEHSFNTQCGHERLDIDYVKRISISHRALDRSVDFAELVPHLMFLPALEEFIVVAEREETPFGSQVVLEEPEPRDPEITSLQRWLDIEFLKNQSQLMIGSWNSQSKSVLKLKVMEAGYECMYPPPARRPSILVNDIEGIPKKETRHVEAPAESWSEDLMRSLDLLSFE